MITRISNPTFQNKSTYQSATVTTGKTSYNVMQVTGEINYVSVLNNNSPFATLGREFASFAAAKAAYKSPMMQTILLMADVALNA